MRGVFVVSTAEITMDGDRNSRPTVELELQATQGDVQEIMRDRDRLEELLAKRGPAYESAEITVDTDESSPQDVAADIAEALELKVSGRSA